MTPLAILKEILLEAGFDHDQLEIPFPSHQHWHRIMVVDRSYINNHLRFTVAINNDGRIWGNKGYQKKTFEANIHDPDSIEAVIKELKGVRELHAIDSK